ncbi:acetylornithine deacetylase [Scenedesmus sp. PABB004]|nr:acetylornithine deacetylase [Scenedesmus sp. PABB004]
MPGPLAGFSLDEGAFLALLEKLIGESKWLQNNPPELVPVEDRAARHVLDVLTPLSVEEGGPLLVKHVTFVEGRGNIIVEYPGQPGGGVISFVGAHMDVVTANPESWSFDPFTLTRDGDKLAGRGVTDCLGHVALLAELFRQLGAARPALKTTVVGVFIANEENATLTGIGVDELVKQGLLDKCKEGPLYWVDTADSQPCIGTGGIAAWQLTAHGKLFHSGLPHKSINPIELAMDAVAEIQRRFYKDYGPAPQEERYGFATPSTLKPTQWSLPAGSINQIPGSATVCGDVRVTPFYDMDKVMASVRSYVADINAAPDALATGARGPASRYALPDEGLAGRVELKFFDNVGKGVACDLDSKGFKALVAAFTEVTGDCKPYSITGSLPCIRDLQEAGFDVQTLGFGKLAAYHANNEYAYLSDFVKGFRVLAALVDAFDEASKA